MGRYGASISIDGEDEEMMDDKATFDSDVLFASAAVMPLLFHDLPVGDPARKAAIDAYDACTRCLKSPSLLIEVGRAYEYGKKGAEKLQGLLNQLFSKTKKEEKHLSADDGKCLGVVVDEMILLAFRPSKIKTNKDAERLMNIRDALVATSETELGSLNGFNFIRSDGAKAIAQRIKKTPVADGAYEANPAESVPKLVAAVAKKYDLSDNGAIAYLQMLAMHDCSSKNLKLWNDWSTGDYNKAMKELEEAKLLLKAKRSRAGRNHFLPGGWEEMKAPDLPIETWKVPLFQLRRNDNGKVKGPLNAILPLDPCHLLFEKAWQRVLDGDQPSYEEV